MSLDVFDLFSDVLRTPPTVVKRRNRKRRSTFDTFTSRFKHEIVEDFVPPVALPDKHTLILDLDETLIHSSQFPPHPNIDSFKLQDPPFYIFKRPGLDAFIRWAQANFDVFVYTYAQQNYADPILDKIFKNLDQDHRYYRDSCEIRQDLVFKDIEMLGRSLKNTILVDDSSSAMKFHPTNTIAISKWQGTPRDSELESVIKPILEECLLVDDVRTIITRPRGRRPNSTSIRIATSLPT